MRTMMGERSNADEDGDVGMDMYVYKDKDEDMDEEEDRDDDGKKMVGQLGLTDASCQRPWREQTPAAGERAMTSISLSSLFIISGFFFRNFDHINITIVIIIDIIILEKNRSCFDEISSSCHKGWLGDEY